MHGRSGIRRLLTARVGRRVAGFATEVSMGVFAVIENRLWEL